MEKQNCPSAKFSRSPFRATQLWNEAISILQGGMPTRRHFYRMRYYDNCFSGKEAVEWLTRTLLKHPRFGKNVTIEGSRKLLQHFLKAGVFQSVKGTLTFKDSGLYEFVDRTIQSPSRKQDVKHVFSHSRLTEIDPNIPQEQRRPFQKQERRTYRQYPAEETSTRVSQLSSKELSWKDFILRRIQSLLPSLSVELLLDPSTVHQDWVMYNVCPEYDSMRKKTELPFWVFTAITSVIRPQEKESEYTTYNGFEKDVYTVVRDYLRHRSSPVVPYNLYELIMYVFNHLHYLDLEEKNRSRERDSVENLVLSMSREWTDENLVHTDELTRTVLPPNSCFETAFTSDEPITRIVPQSSVDTLCLAGYKLPKTPSTVNLPSHTSFKSQTDILKNHEDLKVFHEPKNQILSPLSINPVSNKYKERKKASLRRTQSVAQIDSGVKWNTLPAKSNGRSCLPQQSYVNYGLSQSMDDLLAVDDDVGLDFEQAMQSVNCLLRASCLIPDPQSDSLESLSTGNSGHIDKTSLVCIDSCLWYEEVQETARLVFQAVLMLMSPVSRTSLRMLLQFIDQLPVPPHSTITKTEMVYDLSAHILSPGPHSKNVYSHHMVLSVVYFLVDNCTTLFQDLHVKQLMESSDGKQMENKTCQAEQRVFCEQLSKNQFENQGVTSSWLALAELLDQIISDKKMKNKEKKKRLKKFKEAYPHIYKQRLGGSSTDLANLIHFR